MPAGRDRRGDRRTTAPRPCWSGSTAPASAPRSAPIEAGFGKAPVFMREGGSIPVVGLLKDQLGVDTLLLGWGQNDDNLHGPNEKFSPGRLPPRDQGQRPPAGRAGQGGSPESGAD